MTPLIPPDVPPPEPLGPKPWYLSRTIVGVLILLGAQLVERLFGVTIAAGEQAELVGLVLDLLTAGGGLLAVYGRVKATQPLALVRPPPREIVPVFFAPLLLVGLLIGGPVGCAGATVTGHALEGGRVTPAQALYAVTADYHAAQLAVLPLLEAGALPARVGAEVKRLDREAYRAVLLLRGALRAADAGTATPGEIERQLALARSAVAALSTAARAATPE